MTGPLARLTLDGIINDVEPSDPADCFGRPPEYYEGLRLLTAKIDGQTAPLHACGDTNTGLNFLGCFHGQPALEVGGSGHLDCMSYELTGQRVIAQACVMNCQGYVIDTTYDPLVIVARIGSQWYIVNVLDGANLNPPDRAPCPTGHCCSIGRRDIRVHLSGCSVFDDETLTLRSNNGGSWSGHILKDGQVLSFLLTCDDLVGEWVLYGGCDGTMILATATIDCGGSGSDSGTGTGEQVIGGFTLSGSFGCTDCTTLSGSLTMLSTTFRDRCQEVEYTNQKVRAEACGLAGVIKVGDFVVVAHVPKADPCDGTGTATGTGTGESCTEDDPNTHCPGTGNETTNPQWQIIQTCSDADCEPCPPPPPPPESECCDLDSELIPTTLTGTVAIHSNINECNCVEEIPISFTLVPGSIPAEWEQDAGDIGCDGQTGSGSIGGAVLQNLTGMVVRCGAAGSGEGTGTAGTAEFTLKYPGCADQPPAVSTVAACDPMYIEFDIEIPSCCGPVTDPPGVEVIVSVHMELIG